MAQHVLHPQGRHDQPRVFDPRRECLIELLGVAGQRLRPRDAEGGAGVFDLEDESGDGRAQSASTTQPPLIQTMVSSGDRRVCHGRECRARVAQLIAATAKRLQTAVTFDARHFSHTGYRYSRSIALPSRSTPLMSTDMASRP